MKQSLFGLLSLAAVCSATAPAAAAETMSVKDYTTFFAECPAVQCGKRLMILRSFRQGTEKRVLAVEPETLATEVRSATGLKLRSISWAEARRAISSDALGRALNDSEANGASLQDGGIVHSLPEGNGVVLTVDLCPSLHPLDRRLFNAVIEVFLPEEKPVPVGIAVTGQWMLKHAGGLAWLKKLELDGEIAVTWINHSFNHRYVKGAAMSRNFLLQPGTNLRQEILATEALMLRNGLNPSVFFRFPGLVSDQDLVSRVVSYGLVPIGSDAWLAKKQEPSRGSIVLVHGNGNEPYGVERFLALVRRERSAIQSRNWLLFDLRESVRLEEQGVRR